MKKTTDFERSKKEMTDKLFMDVDYQNVKSGSQGAGVHGSTGKNKH